MGVCTSTTQKEIVSKDNRQIDLSVQEFILDPPLKSEGSETSENGLFDTDELHNLKIQQEYYQRSKVTREVSTNDSPNNRKQQYLIVYDVLFRIERKVPILKSIQLSSLKKKRRLLYQ